MADKSAVMERQIGERDERTGDGYNLIDADAHITKPGELRKRVDKPFRARIPLYVE